MSDRTPRKREIAAESAERVPCGVEILAAEDAIDAERRPGGNRRRDRAGRRADHLEIAQRLVRVNAPDDALHRRRRDADILEADVANAEVANGLDQVFRVLDGPVAPRQHEDEVHRQLPLGDGRPWRRRVPDECWHSNMKGWKCNIQDMRGRRPPCRLSPS